MAHTIEDARRYIADVPLAVCHHDAPVAIRVHRARWRPDLERRFLAFVALIRRAVIVKPWPPDVPTPRYHHTYLSLDGWEYWTTGAPVPETTVINRASLTHDPPAGRDA
jgi:hypothetical protein